MAITPEQVASLLYELHHNNILIESTHNGIQRSIRYAQDDTFSLAISDDDLVSLSDLRSRKAFFTVRIRDPKQSLVDLILRAYSACPERDFFEYTREQLIFPPL